MNIRLLARCAVLGTLAAAAPAADFSFYVLSLSYAPEVCAHGRARDPRECVPGRPAFVVHGLWPQNDDGRRPEKCAPARPVPADVVRGMLKYFPAESLIQQEWATHGTCSGLTPAEYFAAVARVRDSVRIPPAYEAHSNQIIAPPLDVEAEFSRANPGIPPTAIRTACYLDAGLEEVRICVDKSFAPRPCASLSECTKMTIRLSPTRNR